MELAVFQQCFLPKSLGTTLQKVQGRLVTSKMFFVNRTNKLVLYQFNSTASGGVVPDLGPDSAIYSENNGVLHHFS